MTTFLNKKKVTKGSTQWAPVILEQVSQRMRWSATSFIGAHPGPPRIWMASAISKVSFPRNGGGAGPSSAGGGAGAAAGAVWKMFGPCADAGVPKGLSDWGGPAGAGWKGLVVSKGFCAWTGGLNGLKKRLVLGGLGGCCGGGSGGAAFGWLGGVAACGGCGEFKSTLAGGV